MAIISALIIVVNSERMWALRRLRAEIREEALPLLKPPVHDIHAQTGDHDAGVLMKAWNGVLQTVRDMSTPLKIESAMWEDFPQTALQADRWCLWHAPASLRSPSRVFVEASLATGSWGGISGRCRSAVFRTFVRSSAFGLKLRGGDAICMQQWSEADGFLAGGKRGGRYFRGSSGNSMFDGMKWIEL